MHSTRITLYFCLAIVACADAGEPEVDASPDAHSDAAEALPEAERCDIQRQELDSWVLTADGTALRDVLGRTITLRGINGGGRSKFPPYIPFAFEGQADFEAELSAYMNRLAVWGFTVIRLVFTWEAVEPERGQDDELYLERYGAMVDAAWERGVRVIIDFHQDVYSRIYCGDGFPLWTLPEGLLQEQPEDCSNWFMGYLTNPNVRAAFDRFWSDTDGVQIAYHALWDRMIARFGDRPGVIGFEPINEPGWGTANMVEWEREVLSPFYSAIAARMRAAAPEALVFVDATGADALVGSTALVDPGVEGIVFAPHFYDANTVLSGAYSPMGQVRSAIGSWAELGQSWDVPVFVGEFGASHSIDGAELYVRDHMDALDELGLGGAYWEYSTASDRWSQEDMALVEADGTERPPIVNGLIRPYFHALSGSELAVTFDSEARVLHARWIAAADEVTEIVLPERVYPRGVRVGLSDGCVAHDGADRLLRIRTSVDGPVELDLRPLNP